MDLGRRGTGRRPSVLSTVTIHVDTSARRLTFAGRDGPRTFTIAVGKPSTPTPSGRWQINYKEMHPSWNVLGSRWMGLNNPAGNYGIHGTNAPWTIGRAVSNGCIRMHNHDIESIYDLCPAGTPVLINQGYPPPGEWEPSQPSLPDPTHPTRTLRRGDRGHDVRVLQQRLAAFGHYHGAIDGIFGPQTEQAVREFQASSGLQPDGIAGPRTLARLGL